MTVSVTVPDNLIEEMDEWRATQLTPDGQFLKYADTEGLIQQNFNDSLGQFFIGKAVADERDVLEGEIAALTAAYVLTPPKTPVPVS